MLASVSETLSEAMWQLQNPGRPKGQLLQSVLAFLGRWCARQTLTSKTNEMKNRFVMGI